MHVDGPQTPTATAPLTLNRSYTHDTPSTALGGLGLTVTRFFDTISDDDVRRFLDPGLLEVLDAIFAGRVAGEDLRRITTGLVDFPQMLKESRGRREVLSLIPHQKRQELEARIGRSVQPWSRTWTQGEVADLLDFFGLLDEPGVGADSLAINTVEPDYGLFDHQRVAVGELEPLLADFDRRAILHLPTGVGKTRTAMHIVAQTLKNHEPSIVVWLASGRELLEQAVDAFRVAWKHLGTRPVQLASMWGSRTPDLGILTDGLLVVGLAKAWALMQGPDPGWAARLAPKVRMVVYDEAHQSIARTYRRITDELTIDYRCSLLGLTATPGRTWADIDADGKLADFFSRNKVTLKVPGDNPIAFLIDEGYLARPHFRTLLADPGLRINSTERSRIARALDIPRDILERLTMSEQYVTAVLAAVEDLIAAGHQRVLVFAATVDHAKVLTAILAVRGVRSSVVTGATPSRNREHAIARFRRHDDVPMVLVNFGVLTTGFDAPRATAVVIARPTKSLVLFSQMVGRGIRGPRAGGTADCTIVTVVDPTLPGFGDVAAAFLNWEDVWQ